MKYHFFNDGYSKNLEDIEFPKNTEGPYAYRILEVDSGLFVAITEGNIDDDTDLDRWSINEDGLLTHEKED